jgi:hypothetical protein
MPSHITSLSVAKDRVLVGLEVDSFGTDELPDAVVPLPLPPPIAVGRGPWSSGNLGMTAALQDAVEFDGEFDETYEKPRVPDDQIDAALAELKEDARRNPTNPFFAYMSGWLLDRAKKSGEATKAYEAAVATSIAKAPWSDSVVLSAHLARRGQDALSKKAFDDGLAKMEAQGIRRDHIYSLITSAVLFSPYRRSVEQAVEAKDFGRVDVLSSRFQALTPGVEAGHMVWGGLASWFADNGQAELARKWRGHAKNNAKLTAGTMQNIAGHVDTALLWLVALMFAFYPAALVIGFRRSRKEHWWPEVRVSEVVGVILIGALGTPFALEAASDVAMIGHFASAPISTMSEGWSDPAIVAKLETFVDSDAKAAAIQAYGAERDALTEGRALGPPPDPNLYWDAAHTQSREQVGYNPMAIFSIAAMGGDETMSSGPGGAAISAAFGGTLVGIVLLLIFGGLVGRAFTPDMRRRITYAIPGGASAAGPITPFVMAASIAPFFAFAFGFDRTLTSIAAPAFEKYFGLNGIELGVAAHPDRTYLVVVLVIAVLAHLITCWLDHVKATA